MVDVKNAPKENTVGGVELSERDFDRVAEFIRDEVARRASKRKDDEKKWREVDRQVELEAEGRTDPTGAFVNNGPDWMPALEAPGQTQSLEVLCADTRRLLFPDDRNWFTPHGNATDEYYARANERSYLSGLAKGQEVPSTLVQEDVDAMIDGSLEYVHSLYNFRHHIDLILAEAFKYGTYVARTRMVETNKYLNEFRGVVKKTRKFPVLLPRSIRNTYLDDAPYMMMGEGYAIGPATIESWWQNIDDVRMAAAKGSKDPTKENGGWRPEALSSMKALDPKRKTVQVLDYEGDIVIQQDQGRPIFLPNTLWTIIVQSGGPKVIRYREREFAFNSYLSGGYHFTGVMKLYGQGPLVMAAPLQKAVTEGLNRLMQSSILAAEPPVSWNPDDPWLSAQGGPTLAPGAKFPTLGDVKPINVVSPEKLGNVLSLLLRLYEQIVGVNAPRLGAQTKSHTTAFAKDVEIGRSEIRTVDFARSMMFGFLPNFLQMEYAMTRKALKKSADIYLPKFDMFVSLDDAALPDECVFDVHGAAGPLEEREAEAKKQQALNLALSIEQQKAQVQPDAPPLDLAELQRTVLADGGWQQLDSVFRQASGGQIGLAEIADAAGNAGGAGLAEGESPDAQLAALVEGQGL